MQFYVQIAKKEFSLSAFHFSLFTKNTEILSTFRPNGENSFHYSHKTRKIIQFIYRFQIPVCPSHAPVLLDTFLLASLIRCSNSGQTVPSHPLYFFERGTLGLPPFYPASVSDKSFHRAFIPNASWKPNIHFWMQCSHRESIPVENVFAI